MPLPTRGRRWGCLAALAVAASKGIISVAAAGNDPTGKPTYPAAYPSVLAVSAIQPDGAVWPQSNYGSFVDLSAPGFATLPVPSARGRVSCDAVA